MKSIVALLFLFPTILAHAECTANIVISYEDTQGDSPLDRTESIVGSHYETDLAQIGCKLIASDDAKYKIFIHSDYDPRRYMGDLGSVWGILKPHKIQMYGAASVTERGVVDGHGLFLKIAEEEDTYSEMAGRHFSEKKLCSDALEVYFPDILKSIARNEQSEAH